MFSIRELHSYSSRVRANFVGKLSELSWADLEKNREASFHSMKNILVHMIENEEWIVNCVIPGRTAEYKRKKPEEYRNMQAILDYLNEVEKKTETYLRNADEKEMKRRVKLTLRTGDEVEISAEEWLFQSFTEQLYHLGELIALMWQDNIEPPRMQWFWINPRDGTKLGSET